MLKIFWKNLIRHFQFILIMNIGISRQNISEGYRTVWYNK